MLSLIPAVNMNTLNMRTEYKQHQNVSIKKSCFGRTKKKCISIFIKPANKDGAICILKCEDYIKKVEELSNPERLPPPHYKNESDVKLSLIGSRRNNEKGV